MILISIFDWLSFLTDLLFVVQIPDDIDESSKAEKVKEAESLYHLVTSLVTKLTRGGNHFVET